MQLPPRPTGTRYIHVHRNVPGMLGRLNDVFSQRGLNIAAQYLQTDGEIGYVVLEADGVGPESQAHPRRDPRPRRHDPRAAAVSALLAPSGRQGLGEPIGVSGVAEVPRFSLD